MKLVILLTLLQYNKNNMRKNYYKFLWYIYDVSMPMIILF